METNASIIILTPILVPVAIAMGVDPVHFGIIMIVNLALGMCTPPLGINLFISSEIAKIKLGEITRGIIPFYVSLLIVLIIITYFPDIVMFLPNLLGK